ncbi:MAG: hypothetical protein KDA60_15635 [Planctomycetales bacterium]|nr:hypothetical protein [Planctomycetales bacterium]
MKSNSTSPGRSPSHFVARLMTVGCLTLLLACSSGCVGMLAQILHVGLGNNHPARFPGLKEKRVAVVCLSESSAFGPSQAASELAEKITTLVGRNVDKVQVISQEAVSDWMDRNDWNELDYEEIGEGLHADMVVGIELGGFSLHEGTTLYRGRADVTVTVYDITLGGRALFEDTMAEIVYPVNSGQYSTEISETEFRRRFLNTLAFRVARNFYPYDATIDYGQDALMLE